MYNSIGTRMKPEDFLDDQYRNSVKTLFKGFINILEDLQEDHIRNFNKLYKAFDDDDLVAMADYFDDEKFQWLRKKVLDLGNNCIREIEVGVDKIDIQFKFKQ